MISRSNMPGKRVQLDEETWAALDLLARDRMMEFQELADEAFSDLLAKHDRPVGLKAALRQSAHRSARKHPQEERRNNVVRLKRRGRRAQRPSGS
jgi:hypothetical protein